MKTLLIALAAMWLLACAAPAPVPAPPQVDAGHVSAVAPGATAPGEAGQAASTVAVPAAAAQAEKSPDDVICKTEKVTGSLFIRRLCHTRAEWKKMELAAEETMRDIESQPRPIRQ